MNALDTLTIGKMYEVKNHPFKQVRREFVGYYAGVAFDCASFITEGGLIRFSDWDFNEAMEYGEITIIEIPDEVTDADVIEAERNAGYPV